MNLGRRRRGQQYGNPNGSLVAAGARVSAHEAESIRRITQSWQARSFTYYDLLGEIKYSANFYANSLSKLDLYPAEIDDKGEVKKTTNPEVLAEFERLQDPGGGRSRLLNSFGKLMFLVGDAFLLCTKDPETDVEQWEMLSSYELRPNPSGRGYQRYRAPSLQPETLTEPSDDDWEPISDSDAIAYRLWQPHPMYSELSDSTMRGVLDLCEELVLLTQAVRARARSRVAGAGILFIDERISKAPPDPQPGEDPVADKFINNLTNAMIAPLADEGSPSSVVPLVVRVPVPADEKQNLRVQDMVFLQQFDSVQHAENANRMELIMRIAISLDMPPERLTGLGNTSHWNAWEISDDDWKNHIQPKAELLVDSLTSSFFRPTLRDRGVEDWWRYTIAYDESGLVVRPDRSSDAKEIFDRGGLSHKALRRENGFGDEDKPDEEEHREWIGIQLRDIDVALGGEPGTTTNGGGGREQADPEQEEGTPATTDRVPPVQDDAEEPSNGNGFNVARMAQVARIMGAADSALARAREMAGNRLLNAAKRDTDLLAELVAAKEDGAAVGSLPWLAGRPRFVKVIPGGEAAAVYGARDLLIASLAHSGLDVDVVVRIADNVEQHAIKTLFQQRPAPLPSTFENWLEGAAAIH